MSFLWYRMYALDGFQNSIIFIFSIAIYGRHGFPILRDIVENIRTLVIALHLIKWNMITMSISRFGKEIVNRRKTVFTKTSFIGKSLKLVTSTNKLYNNSCTYYYCVSINVISNWLQLIKKHVCRGQASEPSPADRRELVMRSNRRVVGRTNGLF